MHPYADNIVNRENIVHRENVEEQSSFNLSPPSLCSYLPNQISQLTFLLLQPTQSIDSKLYTHTNSTK